jgi:hypothetical protein
MPLRRAPGIARPEQKSVGFLMQDARSGTGVICRISEAALRRLSASPVHGMQTMFEQHRRTLRGTPAQNLIAGSLVPS